MARGEGGGREEQRQKSVGSIDRSIDEVLLPLSRSVSLSLDRLVAREADGEEEGRGRGQRERGKKRDESTSKRYRLTNWDRRRRREGGGSPEGSPRCTIISFADRTLPRVNLLVG